MPFQLHAKTYYNAPSMRGGDEHYIDVPDMKGRENAYLEYRGTGWEMIYGTVSNEMRPIGGYLNIFVELSNCMHEELRDATLILMCTYSYWFSPPTSGMGSVNWDAELSGTNYKITRVTV